MVKGGILLLKAKNLGLSWMGFQPFEFRGALIKYLGNDSDVTDQIKAFCEMEHPENIVRAIRAAENYRNQEREIRFVNEVISWST